MPRKRTAEVQPWLISWYSTCKRFVLGPTRNMTSARTNWAILHHHRRRRQWHHQQQQKQTRRWVNMLRTLCQFVQIVSHQLNTFQWVTVSLSSNSFDNRPIRHKTRTLRVSCLGFYIWVSWPFLYAVTSSELTGQGRVSRS